MRRHMKKPGPVQWAVNKLWSSVRGRKDAQVKPTPYPPHKRQVQCLHPVSRLHPKAVWMAVTGEHLRLHPRQNRKLLRMIMAHAKFIQTIVSSQEDSQSTTLCSAERSLAAGSASSTATMAESAAADQKPAAVRTAEAPADLPSGMAGTSLKRKLLSCYHSLFGDLLTDFKKRVQQHEEPLCSPESSNAPHSRKRRGECTEIQRLVPIHWLHPRAIMVATLYNCLVLYKHTPRRLLDVLVYQKSLIRYVDPHPGIVGWRNMTGFSMYLLNPELLERDCRTSQGRINSSARTGRVPTSSTHTAQGLVGEGCPDTASAPLEPDLDAALIGDAAKMAATYISDSTVMDVMSCLSTLTEDDSETTGAALACATVARNEADLAALQVLAASTASPTKHSTSSTVLEATEADSDGVHSIGIFDARKTAASGRLVIDVMASSAANSAPDVMELFKLPTNSETSGAEKHIGAIPTIAAQHGMQHDMEISDPAAGRSISSFCTSDKPSNMKAKDCPFKPTLASTCSSTSAISAAGSMGSKKGESASQSKLSAFEAAAMATKYAQKAARSAAQCARYACLASAYAAQLHGSSLERSKPQDSSAEGAADASCEDSSATAYFTAEAAGSSVPSCLSAVDNHCSSAHALWTASPSPPASTDSKRTIKKKILTAVKKAKGWGGRAKEKLSNFLKLPIKWTTSPALSTQAVP